MNKPAALILLTGAAAVAALWPRRQAQPPAPDAAPAIGYLGTGTGYAPAIGYQIDTTPETEPPPSDAGYLGTVTDAASRAWGALSSLWDSGPTVQAEPGDYFKPADFRDWWPLMSPELVRKLNSFAKRVAGIGGRVYISPDTGALGRSLGFSDTSQHNVDRWGEVRAADVMLTGINLKDAYELARFVGFTGIGAYPDWLPDQGMHLDVRQDRTAGNPATWSGAKINGQQVVNLPIDRAWA